MAETATYRERRLRKAERLRGWADGREARSDAAHAASREATAMIPLGQPILVGHHSQRRHERALERARNAATASIEHADKADEMRSRAANIEAAADAAIYDDDPDAIERLTEKLAALEAERERIKAYNASCRKAAKTGGVGDVSLLSEKTRGSLEGMARIGYLRPGGALPAYATSNLTGNIGRTRDRLERLKRIGSEPDRIITARFSSECADCGAALERGVQIRYTRAKGARCFPECQEGG